VSGFGIWAAGIDALVRRRRPSRCAVAALVVAGSGLLLLCGSGAGLGAVLAASVFLAVYLLLLAAAARPSTCFSSPRSRASSSRLCTQGPPCPPARSAWMPPVGC
jgi:drug/metabolite transporter (DMT)-like permease